MSQSSSHLCIYYNILDSIPPSLTDHLDAELYLEHFYCVSSSSLL